MLKPIMTFFLLAAFSLPVFSQGYQVTVPLSDGTSFTGELIYARSNGLLMYPGELFRNAELEKFTHRIQFIPQSQITEIRIPGHSYVLRGIIVGILLPTGFVYLASKDNKEFLGYGLVVAGVFSSIGAVIGGFVGKWSSVKEQQIPVSSDTSLDSLKKYARLQGSEPEYLQSIK